MTKEAWKHARQPWAQASVTAGSLWPWGWLSESQVGGGEGEPRQGRQFSQPRCSSRRSFSLLPFFPKIIWIVTFISAIFLGLDVGLLVSLAFTFFMITVQSHRYLVSGDGRPVVPARQPGPKGHCISFQNQDPSPGPDPQHQHLQEHQRLPGGEHGGQPRSCAQRTGRACCLVCLQKSLCCCLLSCRRA